MSNIVLTVFWVDLAPTLHMIFLTKLRQFDEYTNEKTLYFNFFFLMALPQPYSAQ